MILKILLNKLEMESEDFFEFCDDVSQTCDVAFQTSNDHAGVGLEIEGQWSNIFSAIRENLDGDLETRFYRALEVGRVSS